MDIGEAKAPEQTKASQIKKKQVTHVCHLKATMELLTCVTCNEVIHCYDSRSPGGTRGGKSLPEQKHVDRGSNEIPIRGHLQAFRITASAISDFT
jgi:hypothetical protein